MRIGVLGGSFDPPHLAHRALAELAQRQLSLDLVLWVPASLQWQKQAETSADIRSHMCELAIADRADWQVSNVDLDRGGETYTVDTLADLRLAYPQAELVLLLGSDAAAGLETWHQADSLRSERIAVAERAGESHELPTGFSIEHIAGKLPAISSTEIRAAVTRGDSISEWVEPVVDEYVHEVGLYA